MSRGRSTRRWSVRWIALALVATSCAGDDDSGEPVTDVTETTEPAGRSPDQVAVVVPVPGDPLVAALESAGVDVVAILVDPDADGSCPSGSTSVSVGCDGAVVDDTGAGTVVAVSVPEARVRAVLDQIPDPSSIDVILSSVPESHLGSVASITVIPEDVASSTGYRDLIVNEVAGNDPVVYEVRESAAGTLRVGVALIDAEVEPVGLDDSLDGAAEAEVVWAFEVGATGTVPGIHSRSATDGEGVYFLGFDGFAYAVDAATGAELWRYELAGEGSQPASASYVALAADAIVVSYSPQAVDVPGQRVIGLNRSDGELLWERELVDIEYAGHPVVVGGSVVLWLGNFDGANLVSLDPRSGEELWRSPTYERPGVGPPRSVDGQIFAGTLDGSVIGVDAAHGAERFRFDQPVAALVGIGGIASRPAWDDGVLLFGADDGVFRAVDTATGTVSWEYVTGSADVPSSPLIVDDVVVFGAFDERLYGLDVATGRPRWTATVGNALSSALRVGDDVVIGAGNNVIGVDPATGNVRWRFATDGWVIDSPVAIGADVVVQIRGQMVRLTPPS